MSKQRNSPPAAPQPIFAKPWFEWLSLAVCLAAGWLLFHQLLQVHTLEATTLQQFAMAKLIREGHYLSIFTQFSQPPLYALVLAGVIQWTGLSQLQALTHYLQQVNLGLYLISILLVHLLAKRHIRKPYSLLITALYTVSPPVLESAWHVDASMLFLALSLGALYLIDCIYSKQVQFPARLTTHISSGELTACGALIALCILSHPAGYALLVAFAMVSLKKFGLKRTLLAVSVLLLCISPFVGRDLFYWYHQPQALASAKAFWLTGHQAGWGVAIQTYTDSLLLSATHHTVGDLHTHVLMPWQSSTLTLTAAQVLWARWTLGVLLLLGLLYGLTTHSGILSLYLGSYLLGFLLLSPVQHPFSLLPVFPLLLLYLYFGLMRLGEWSKKLHLPVSKLAGPILTGWILLCAFSTLIAHSGTKMPLPDFNLSSLPNTFLNAATHPLKVSPEQAPRASSDTAHQRALAWLDTHTPSTAKVAIPRPQAASQLIRASHRNQELPSKLKAELSQYDYLVEEGVGHALSQTINNQNSWLKLIYEDKPGQVRIWHILELPH